MAQTMVNFRMDEDLKKGMEQACKEMGLSMTTAFTMFSSILYHSFCDKSTSNILFRVIQRNSCFSFSHLYSIQHFMV